MRRNTHESIEREEIIHKLNENGFDRLVDAFLMNEEEVYTKKGRLNKSGACRILGCTPKELDIAFREAKALLRKDMNEE